MFFEISNNKNSFENYLLDIKYSGHDLYNDIIYVPREPYIG